MKEKLEDYKTKAHILEKQLDQAERHIMELKKTVRLQDEIISCYIKEDSSSKILN